MKRTSNGILIPDVPIMAGGNLPNAVKGVSAGGGGGFDPSRTPFYIDVLTTLSLDNSNLQISDDAKNWQICGSRTLNKGRYYFRGEQTTERVTIGITSQNQYNVGGNIMSLISYTWDEATLYDACFNEIFKDTKVVEASALLLPATTLATQCYRHMFQNCTSLTTAPALPAMTLADSCYKGMFQGCAALTTAPALPAMTLAAGCYSGMFQGCAALTTAPELHAMTLARSCYNDMFAGCTSLTTAPDLHAMTLAQSCYNGMFQGCAALTTAPELPATTLATQCCYEMFKNCTKLNYIKSLATDISASNCTANWVTGVAANGTFVKKRGVEWPTGVNGIPTGWTVKEID